ncbi:MAG: Stk1 family PASTA domain-containing Ser/Thr kinase [Oscillospiraceae bacterium]|jgi:serine/threonine-protein kinase|nr:Stk1 family PASTA domain-containing Ser/Thr kinase [Oscillospiraceae bacterium]
MDGKDSYIGMMLDNRYEILEKVGEGGMALVYKARCHRLNRLVAIKILREEHMSDNDFQRRFHAESQAVAMLSHPNIVAVYDVNQFQGIDYLVMELIDGITLKQYMSRKKSLNWREALHFVTQITRALGHAHSRGIIHRDIKPHNIMVLRDGSVKVADFGIARLASSQNTLTQEALGSVHYISPEQARGGQVDARSDIYSVGIVLYEMLTGRLPFEGDSPVSVAIQHISSMALSPREIDPSIPVGIEEITMKAMEADVDRRYSSADEMYFDLEEFRKNPQIVFGYKAAGPASIDSGNDEPTIIIPKSEIKVVNRSTPQIKKDRNPPAVNQRRDREPPKGRGGVVAMAIAVVAILAVVIGLIYFLWGVMKPVFFPESKNIDVPELVGLIYDDIKYDPKYADFEIVASDELVYDNGTPGTIISQRPTWGRTAEPGSKITVTVSGGVRTLVLDDYRNVEQRTAEIRIAKQGFKVGAPEYENSDEVMKDYVIRTIPEYGAEMTAGDEVVLVLSLGPNVVKVKMPDLTKRTEEAAKQALQNAKLTFGGTTLVESQQPVGEVVYQSVQAGLEIDEGTTVSLHVSMGSINTQPSEPPTPTPAVSSAPQPTATPEPVEKTKMIEIKLPSDKSSVLVTVKVNGKTIYDQTVDTSQGMISVPVTAAGSVWVDIYFDGKLGAAQEFNVN